LKVQRDTAGKNKRIQFRSEISQKILSRGGGHILGKVEGRKLEKRKRTSNWSSEVRDIEKKSKETSEGRGKRPPTK